MSRAEERAREAYPSTRHYWNSEPDRNMEAREYYKQGYEQAEKDFMEKAEKWWYDHLVGFLKEGLTEGVISEFRQHITKER